MSLPKGTYNEPKIGQQKLFLNIRTPTEKYMVKPRLPRYAAVKGRRSFENRCFKCAIGPINIENLNKIHVRD